MSFRGYVFASLLLTSAVIGHAVYMKRFFYRSVIFLANSKLAILAVGNMALVSILLMWRLTQAVFLGPLRFREVERLHIRARDAIIECCFALSIFREDFDVKFVALVVAVLMLKSLHWLLKDRIEFLEEQPLSPVRTHVRLVGLMVLLFAIDTSLVRHFATATFRTSGPTFLVLFAFEFTVSIIELLGDMIRYCFLLIDSSMDGHWEGKSMCSFYVELLSDLCQLTVYVLFFIYIQIYYTFPFHILRELYVTFSRFQRRCSDFWRYRRVVATMNDLFADATEEELHQGDRTCIICREEMQSAKKLECGHIFHARCLQSWLKRQLSCPTCRATIDVNSPAGRSNNARNARQENAAPNNQPRQNQQNNNNNDNNAAPQGNNREAANLGEAGVRLLNLANQWWNQVMIEAGARGPGAGAAEGVQAARGGRRVQGSGGAGGDGDGGGGGGSRNNPGQGVQGVGGANPNGGRMHPQDTNRPQEHPPNNAMAGNVFLRGPNAVAHMQFRARRRVAWPYPYQPYQMQQQVHFQHPNNVQNPNPYQYQQLNFRALYHTNAGQAQGNQAAAQPAPTTSPQVTANQTAERESTTNAAPIPGIVTSVASERQSPLAGADDGHESGEPSSSILGRPSDNVPASGYGNERVQSRNVAFGQKSTSASGTIVGRQTCAEQAPELLTQRMPLDRLLAIQERIEELRSEVMDLILLATTSTPEDTGTSSTAAEGRSGDDVIEPVSNALQDGNNEEGLDEAAARSDGDRRQVGDEEEEDDSEAATLRRHRMEFLNGASKS